MSLACALLLALAGAPAADEAAIERGLAALEASDPERWGEAFQALAAAGDEAVARALATLDGAGVQGARSRARLVAEAGGVAAVPAVLGHVDDSDPDVRVELVRFLGGFALGEALAEERLAALARAAESDPSDRVRRAALRGLSRSGLPSAAETLDGLLERLPASERPLAVECLVACPLARARIVARTRALFAAPLAALDAPSAARLLRAYGKALADVPGGGDEAPERVPFVAGRRHPDERLRRAALAALDAALDRLVELGEEERADALLAALGREGIDPRETLYRRSLLALAVRGAPEDARRFAAELARAGAGADAADRTWRFYAEHLGAAAALALGRAEEAYDGFAAAGRTMRALLAERDDQKPAVVVRDEYPQAPLGAAIQVERLQFLALEEAWQALARFELLAGQGLEPVDRRALEHLRQAHLLLLQGQLFALEHDADYPASHAIDDLLERELAPHRLVLGDREQDGWHVPSGIDLELLLARGFASVAPREMPGFEPALAADGPLSDPFLDDARFSLLQRIQEAALDASQRAWLYERGRIFERARDAGDPDLADRATLLSHPLRLQMLEEQRAAGEMAERLRTASPADRQVPELREELWRELADQRPPTEHALTLAAELRVDGRAAEARALSERMLEAVREGLAGAGTISTEILSARIELSISSSYTDEARPREAEREALAAVKRLRAFENTIEERMAEERDPGVRDRMQATLRQVQRMRSGALLSLAVNANVRLDDQPRALDYFEKAYQLDQRDFMRVLLACYRARSGKREEALAVLRTVQPAPPLYYNLACTYALLGEADEALDFLRRELDENHPGQGSRRRQVEWARADPDLASLRADPRFARLLET